MRFLNSAVLVTLTGVLFGMPSAALAASARVAVAANFTGAANEIAAAFADNTEHDVVLSFGSTGQFYTQITQEAPFDVFLAADDQRAAQAVREGYGVADTVFTYAVGQLALYSADDGKTIGPDTLRSDDFRRISIANPVAAPYGAAAIEVMKALDVYQALESKIVYGQNVGQAYQFVQTGNTELGFVALGQVVQADERSRWVVPSNLYEPIRQDAVLLNKGKNNPAAMAFLEFLKGDVAATIIRNYGYDLAP